MTAKIFTSLVGAGLNEATATTFVMVLDAAGQRHELHFAEGMTGGLVLALMHQLRLFQEQKSQVVSPGGQLTALTDVRGVVLPDGQMGLEMTFENAIRLLSPLSAEILEQLHNELESLEDQTTAQSGPQRH